jgi:hypothetical protein
MFIWWTPAGRHTWRKRKGVSTLAFCKVKVSYFFTFWHHAFLHGTYFNATCWKVGQRETIIGPDCHETLLVFWILVWFTTTSKRVYCYMKEKEHSTYWFISTGNHHCVLFQWCYLKEFICLNILLPSS